MDRGVTRRTLSSLSEAQAFVEALCKAGSSRDLHLLLDQKSDWEIAQILGLKEDTVTEYLDAARARYGVARRIQLVLRAVHDGHVALSDVIE